MMTSSGGLLSALLLALALTAQGVPSALEYAHRAVLSRPRPAWTDRTAGRANFKVESIWVLRGFSVAKAAEEIVSVEVAVDPGTHVPKPSSLLLAA